MIRNRWIALGLSVAGTLATAGCSGSPGATPATTAMPTPGLAAATDVVGHNTCALTNVPTTSAETGELTCSQVASDARLTGDLTATFKYVDLPSGANLMWGSNTLTNAGGTWTCDFVGLRSPVALHAFDFSCKGAGGYAGLWAYYQQDGDVDYSSFSGWIEYRQ